MSNSSFDDGWPDSADGGDGDSFRSCRDDEPADETDTTKSVSWTDRNANENSASARSLKENPFLSEVRRRNDVKPGEIDEAVAPFSDEEDENGRDGRGESARTLGAGEMEGDNDLPFDSFSMLFVARDLLEHCLPLVVFGLQMLILVLIMINLLQTSDRPLVTSMNVPVDVPLTVKISQYIACMVSVFTADDLVSGALHVGRRVVKKGFMDAERERISLSPSAGERRKSEVTRHLLRSISEADHMTRRKWKWELANSMRIVEGALVIVVAFIFIAQSVTAIDLWLNFAAVQFVGMLDDTAYHLARNRFLGSMARHLANRVSEFEVYSEGEKNKKKIRRFRLLLFVGIGIAMWAGLSVFVYNQANLTYACSSVTLAVGESRHHYARFYSGKYVIQRHKIHGRAVYYQEQGRGALIAYCGDDDVNRWTISPLNKTMVLGDPCSNIVMQSHRTKTHDISEIGDGMQFWTGDDADSFIKCNNCNMGRKGGDCSFRGTCDPDSRLCECDQGFFGDSCQFRGPCTEMVMHDEFHGVYTHSYQKKWDLMYLDDGKKPVMVYGRPVYVQNVEQDIFDVMMYDGGRWFVSQSDYFSDWYNGFSGKERADKSLANYLIWSFNARDSEYIASYIAAEASTSGSPSNIPFRAWLTEASKISSHIGKLGEEEYTAICSDCNNGESGISSCKGFGGEADNSLCKVTANDVHGAVNRCVCPPGFSGPLCHLRPIEGKISLHLDHSPVTRGQCSTCYEDNPWVVRDLDGSYIPCLPMGKLFFDDGNETFSRELGLHLNASHFSVFVSGTDDTLDTLCLLKEGTEEVISIRQDVEERIYVNAAVHLDNRKDFLGEVVKPEEVHCIFSTEVDHDVCTTSLTQVYSTPDMKTSMLKDAWLRLDLKVTPAARDVDDTVASPQNDTSPVILPTSVSIESSSSEHSPVQAPNSTILLDDGAANVASATAEQYAFAVIPKAISNAFFIQAKDGCEERAAALSRPSVRGSVSVKCLFVGPTEFNGTEQARIANDLIGSVDGIAMSVINETLAVDVAKNAFAAGTPFITFDSDAPSTQRAAYVGTNNIALGEELGTLLLTRFASSGSYAIISGVSPNLARRETGIRNVLNGRFHEVETVNVGRDPIAQMQVLMKKYPDLTAILITLGGVMRATAGRNWEDFVIKYPDLILLSADAMPVQIDLMNRGYVDGLVGQQPADMGSKSIDTLLSLSKGHEVDDFIPTKLVVMGRVNEDNPYSYLALTSSATMMCSSTSLFRQLLGIPALGVAVMIKEL